MFAGSLKTFSTTNLMQMCYNENNTGIIEFKKKDTSYAFLSFINGRIMHAKFLEHDGISAVRQLTLIQDLDFHFIAQAPDIKPNIKTDINFLLLDCIDYIDQLKNVFPVKYALKGAGFYQYEHGHFASCDLYRIKYFEIYNQPNMNVIYQDKNIKARINLLFSNRILTNDLLTFMTEKDMLG
jgi:Domain of unknown function (DUF4388)